MGLGQEGKLRATKDPLGILELIGERLSKQTHLPFRRWRGYFFTDDLVDLFLIVQPVRPARETSFARELMDAVVVEVNAAREEIREWADDDERRALSVVRLEPDACGTPTEIVQDGAPPPTIRVLFTGGYPIQLDYQCLLTRDVVYTSIISFIAVMVLFIVSFRRIRVLLYAGLPLLAGLLFTLAFARVVVGKLNVYTAGTMAMICGLGVDYGIHLYNRYLEEVHGGRDMARAFRVSLAETGAGITAAALTTAVAFFALMVSRTRGIRDLGLVCGAGMFFTLATTLILLPAIVALVARVRPTRERERGMSGFGLEPLTRVVVSRHRLVATLLVIVTAGLGLSLAWPQLTGRPYLDDDFAQFRPRGARSVQLDEEINERLGTRLRALQVVLRDDDPSALLDRTARLASALRDRGRFSLVQAATDLVPAPVDQRGVLEGLQRLRTERPGLLDAERIGRSMRLALEEASGRRPGRVFLEAIERVQAAVGVDDPLRPETILDSPLEPLLRRYLSRGLGPEGREISSVIFVNPSSEISAQVALEMVEQTLGRVDPRARVVGFKALGQVVKRQVRRDLSVSLSLAFVGVLVCLTITFRRPVLVALTVVPLVAGFVGALGLLLLLTGEPLSLVGVSMLPLILGIGIDDGIHIVHRFRLHRGESLVGIFHHTGRAITITSLTTIAGFGSLMFAEYAGLRACGLMASLGIASCLVTSVVFLPALLTAVYHRDRGGSGPR
jgi:predicted RND superfamily exporter protein